MHTINADLHCHSVVSDGTLTPEALASRAKNNGVQIWSLTDHDELGGQSRARKAAADLGHYVGDAHVPLHTTSNYNGQKTGQKGIHAFWESRIPELSGGQYSNFVPTVNYIDDPQSFIWEAVLESHRLLGGKG